MIFGISADQAPWKTQEVKISAVPEVKEPATPPITLELVKQVTVPGDARNHKKITEAMDL